MRVSRPACTAAGILHVSVAMENAAANTVTSASGVTTTLQTRDVYQLYLLRISTAGELVWSTAMTTNYIFILNYKNWIAVDAAGASYVTLSYGWNQGSATMAVYDTTNATAPVSTLQNVRHTSAATFKFSSAGALAMTLRISGPLLSGTEFMDIIASAVTVDSLNNVSQIIMTSN